MTKLFWWDLSPQEKAKRSFIFTPFAGLLAYLTLQDSSLSALQVSGIILSCMALMLLQGLFYRRKHGASGESK